MKTKLVTITIGLALIGSPALAENWNVVSRSSQTVYMLDLDSIKEGDGAKSAVLARVPASGAATDLSYSAGEVFIRCTANQSKPGPETVYGPDGAEQERIDDGYDFDAIARGSLDSFIQGILCKDERGAGSYPSIRAFIEAGRPKTD
ncbi:hypothetical protein ACFPIF_04455 [Brevundimonas faecalis]|uniref:hypothetical protein n=1 Tax=Brevundimonas faecalis TaxID=947378 RepID=UPI00361A43AE